MKTVIISPFSRPTRSGIQNAKNYHRWPEVISSLNDFGIRTIQVGYGNEEKLAVTEHQMGLSFAELKKLILSTDSWISVDNLMGHLGFSLNKKGVVIFGKSDPNIFGYPTNTNLLKSSIYLREHQWKWWEDEPFDPEVFVEPDVVVKATLQILLTS